MKLVKTHLAGAVVALGMLGFAGAARAQMGGAGMMGGMDTTAIRDRLLQQFQQQIGATDEEWRVIQPAFMKVLVAQMDSGQGLLGMVRGMGRGAGGRGGAGGGFNMDQMLMSIFGINEPTTVMRREDELQQALDNNASADRLHDKLDALRQARDRAKVDLAKAQTDLIQLLTLRQEAMLVEMGFLD